MHPIEEKIGYKFRNPLLLAEALTHPSLAYESERHNFDYQRLEFLGDAVLQLIVTDRLFRLFPTMPEGRLTKLRTRLVSRDALAHHAEIIGLGAFLLMGRGEEATGGRNRASTLADGFESILGAIYIDSGLEEARKVVLEQFEQAFQDIHSSPVEDNPKGKLQEILQGISPVGPSYFVVGESGPEHSKSFATLVMWEGRELGRGEGRSKKSSEIEAARDALVKQRWK